MTLRDNQLTREDLARLFKGTGVEVGVERGVFSKAICRRSPGVQLYCVDPWKAYKGYRDHVSQEKLDGFYAETQERLYPYGCILMRMTSMEAVSEFEDRSLDFVYIDANHDKAHTSEDVREWAKKVRPGGIVAGHDYIRRKGQADLYGVKDAVNEYAEREGIPELIIWRGDRSPSWSFIKP